MQEANAHITNIYYIARTLIKTYIYNCDCLYCHITYMCISISTYMTKFMGIYI